MPRASDGSVTLPVGNPVVAGTAISATVMNATLADLASMIEDSLSRSGDGGMLVPLEFDAGTVAAPSITFTGRTDTGVYSPADNEVALTAGGTQALHATATSVEIPVDLSVTGALTLAGTISRANLPTVGQQVSASTGTFSSTAAAQTDITNATVTITTTGRPVVLVLQCAGDTLTSRIYVGVDGAATPTSVKGTFRMVRSGTAAATYEWIVSANGAASASLGTEIPPGVIQHIDFPAAGTYTYKLQVACAADTTVAVEYAKLVAYEL